MMDGMAIEPSKEAEEAGAVDHLLDDGAPQPAPVRSRRSRKSRMEAPAELPPEEPTTHWHPAARLFRLYCTACGRSTEGLTAPARPGRCPNCGGTMLLELAPD